MSRLIDKLPYFYDNGYTGPIIEAEQIERDILYYTIEDTIKQFFVETATWGLEYWERMLCLKVNENKSYDERRSLIFAKIRGNRTTTVEVIKELCRSFFEVKEVNVYEDNGRYMFYVELINAKFGNIEDICEVLNTYKPAHLGYGFIFTSKSYVDIKNKSKTGLSNLPICNLFNAGTWWKCFNESSVLKSNVINSKSYTGNSNLVVCGLYTNKTTNKNNDYAAVNNAIVGISKVG